MTTDIEKENNKLRRLLQKIYTNMNYDGARDLYIIDPRTWYNQPYQYKDPITWLHEELNKL